MMVDHGRQERDLYSQPPEKECERQFQLSGKIAILLGVVGKDRRTDAEYGRKTFCSNLTR